MGRTSSIRGRQRRATQHRRLARLVAGAALTATVCATSAVAAGPVPVAEPDASGSLTAKLASIQLRAGVSPQAATLLRRAYNVAASRVAARRECGALFGTLGADGVTTLNRTLYYPPTDRLTRTCARAYAVTGVGSAVTMLCPSFARLDVEKGAMVLIHEALHHAGMAEAPTAGAPTSSQINRAVWTRCF